MASNAVASSASVFTSLLAGDCLITPTLLTAISRLFWNKASLWGLRPDPYYCQAVAGLLMWHAISDERTGLSFARVTVSSNKAVVSIYNLHFTYC
jgi:hypothetical protein